LFREQSREQLGLLPWGDKARGLEILEADTGVGVSRGDLTIKVSGAALSSTGAQAGAEAVNAARGFTLLVVVAAGLISFGAKLRGAEARVEVTDTSVRAIPRAATVREAGEAAGHFKARIALSAVVALLTSREAESSSAAPVFWAGSGIIALLGAEAVWVTSQLAQARPRGTLYRLRASGAEVPAATTGLSTKAVGVAAIKEAILIVILMVSTALSPQAGPTADLNEAVIAVFTLWVLAVSGPVLIIIFMVVAVLDLTAKEGVTVRVLAVGEAILIIVLLVLALRFIAEGCVEALYQYALASLIASSRLAGGVGPAFSLFAVYQEVAIIIVLIGAALWGVLVLWERQDHPGLFGGREERDQEEEPIPFHVVAILSCTL
jgi:hypothetical protein